MRDRLTHLHQVQVDPEGFSGVQLDDLWGPEAAGSHCDQDLDGVLQEARGIRLEIQQIHNDIAELKAANHRALNKATHATADERDSNAIGADVKRRGEAVLQRLHVMNAYRGQLEGQRGGSDLTVRIARTQHQCLSRALQEAVCSYNDAEMSHREACKRQIQRQMEVVGREVSGEELEEMMEREELHVFSVQAEGRTARSALLHIESRHRELLELQQRMEGVQELFLDVALLVEQQGAAFESIQKNVQSVDVAVQDAAFKLERAATSDKNNPFKKMFCGCFPCYFSS